MTAKTLHFSVDPQFVVDITRQAYWFERDRRDWVQRVFECLKPVPTKAQIDKILAGDATFKLVAGDTDSSFMSYVEEVDEDFKAKLQKHLDWRAENYYEIIPTFFVEKDTYNQYVKLKRLSEAIILYSSKYPQVMNVVQMFRRAATAADKKLRDLHNDLLWQKGASRSALDFNNEEHYHSKEGSALLEHITDDPLCSARHMQEFQIFSFIQSELFLINEEVENMSDIEFINYIQGYRGDDE